MTHSQSTREAFAVARCVLSIEADLLAFFSGRVDRLESLCSSIDEREVSDELERIMDALSADDAQRLELFRELSREELVER